MSALDLIRKFSAAIQDPNECSVFCRQPSWYQRHAVVANACVVAFIKIEQSEFERYWFAGGDIEPIVKNVQQTIKPEGWESAIIELPELEQPPGGEWMALSTCDECHGSGEVTCDYDHEHECPECQGSGKVKSLHPLSRREVLLPGMGKFNHRYLWAVQQLQPASGFQFMRGPEVTFSIAGGH